MLEFPLRGGLQRDILWNPRTEQEKSAWIHGGIPILFPFAGNVWAGAQKGYYANGDSILPMPIHGLVHNKPWSVDSIGVDFVCLSFHADADTLKKYPWHFSLKFTWRINTHSLTYRADVHNRGYEGSGAKYPMPVSMGIHPYFKLAEPEEKKEPYLVSNGGGIQEVSPEGKEGSLIHKSSELPQSWQHSLYHNGIIRNFADEVPRVEFFQKQHCLSLEGDALTNCFVLWSLRNRDFYCIEPWMGLPNSINSGLGLRHLQEQEKLQWSGRIQFEERSL